MANGYKSWVAGAQVNAVDVKDYLQLQTVMKFASAAARNSALSAVLREGLTAYLDDVNQVTVYDGANWQIASDIGSWSSYTPTLTNGAVGNGTLAGSYTKRGKTVHAWGIWIWGTTSSMSGTLSFALPMAGATGNECGSVKYLDVGTAHISGSCFMPFTTLVQPVHSSAGNSGLVNATNPFTFASGDEIRFSITYEAA